MFYLRYFDTTSEYQQEESALSSKRPNCAYTEDDEGFHWFPYLRTLSITGMSLTDFGDVTTASTGHWTQSLEGGNATYEGQLVIVGSNLDLISALTISTVNCNVITSVASRKRNRKVYNVTLTVTDTDQAASVVFSYGDVDLSAEYALPDYATHYFTTKALEDSTTFTLTIGNNFPSTGNSGLSYISYSTDNGTTWTRVNNNSGSVNTTSITVNTGESVLWKGSGNTLNYAGKTGSTSGTCRITSDKRYEVNGNIMSLCRESFAGATFTSSNPSPFMGLFYNDTNLVRAKSLCVTPTTIPTSGCAYMFNGCTSLTTAPKQLSPTTLSNYGYENMFQGCTSLVNAPELPATTMANYCYYNMFYGCTSLTTAPELPATTLAGGCYRGMFYDCTSITTAPVLPATTMANNCYYNMFYRCTSLTTAPELPAITLVSSCYYGMFSGCTKLNYIKAMFTTTPSTTYTSNWVSGVASTGTFVKNSAATWDVTGVNGIPTNWTVQTASS